MSDPAGALAQQQWGFRERWLRRCGERPWQWFLLFWAVFFVLAVAECFISFEHRTFDAAAPDPRSIPYADWLPGGIAAEQGVLKLRVEDLPAHDPALFSQAVGLQMQWRSEVEGGPRLTAWRAAYVGSAGWPSIGCSWVCILRWDVSDPTRPFPLITTDATQGLSFTSNSSVGVGWIDPHRMAPACFAVYGPGGLMQLAAPQVAAALIVGSLAIAHRRRESRWARGGRCARCGQQLDPSARPARCPECGNPTTARDRARRRWLVAVIGGPGRLATALFLMIAAAWLIAQIPLRDERTEDVAQNVAGLAATADSLNQSLTKHVIERYWCHGWPMPLLNVQDDQWFVFAPGQSPQRVPDGWGGPFSWRTESMNWVVHRGDPSLSRLYQLNWGIALLELALLHIASVIVGCTLWLLIRSRFGARRADQALA